MYGDTHVEPALLFDPGRGQAPPADALDLYFHAPLSLSLIGDAFAFNDMNRELDQLLDLYAGLAAEVVTLVQRQGGYVSVGPRNRCDPARLEITGMAHNAVPGESTMRLHLHIYVGRTATALNTGERHPVVRDRIIRAADRAWCDYLGWLEEESARVLDFVWAPLPGHTSGDREIVVPPMAEHIAGHEFGVCPGDFGPREQLMVDAKWRADVQESARFIAAERERRTG